MKADSRHSNRFFLFILPILLITALSAAGCSSSNRDLKRINQEQAATIEGLNEEIQRLNQELDELMQSREQLLNAQKELERKLKSELASGDMSMAMEDRGLVLTVQNNILFSSGKAELLTTARTSLEKIAGILKDKVGNHLVFVEGHTDNEPIRVSGWRSNWELSTARATEVVHYFADERGVNPKQFAATGYGEFHPVESNDTEHGKQRNRRVEIVISPRTIS